MDQQGGLKLGLPTILSHVSHITFILIIVHVVSSESVGELYVGKSHSLFSNAAKMTAI